MKSLFIDTVIDDAEWHLGPIVEEAWKIWEKDKDAVIKMHTRLKKDPESNNTDDHNDMWLEDFMTEAMGKWSISKYATKLLFDVCTTLDNKASGMFDVSITVDHGDGLKETITGISHQKCNGDLIALVWDDDVVPEILYGFNIAKMRKGIDALYQSRYSRKEKQHHITFSRTI